MPILFTLGLLVCYGLILAGLIAPHWVWVVIVHLACFSLLLYGLKLVVDATTRQRFPMAAFLFSAIYFTAQPESYFPAYYIVEWFANTFYQDAWVTTFESEPILMLTVKPGLMLTTSTIVYFCVVVVKTLSTPVLDQVLVKPKESGSKPETTEPHPLDDHEEDEVVN